MKFGFWSAALIGLVANVAVSVPSATARELSFITIDVVPWASYEADSGREVGFFPALVREIERRTGHEISMSFHPFARIDRELESGQKDCTILVWSEEKARIAERGAMVSYHPIGVIARNGVDLQRYEDLHTMKVSVLRGAPTTPRFDADSGIDKDFMTDYLIGLRKMARGRVDAIAGAIPTIQYLAEQEGLTARLGKRLTLLDVPLVLQCSKASENLDVMPDLNRAIEAIGQDGTMDRLKEENFFE